MRMSLFLAVVSTITFPDGVVIALDIYGISAVAARVALVFRAVVIRAIRLIGATVLLA